MSENPGPWPGRFVWHDLMTTDAASVVPFYSSLLGWQIHERPMGPYVYRMIMAGPGPIGGIVEEKAIPHSHWMPYLAVESVDGAAERCKELGGSVCVPPTDIPQTGRFAVAGDPQGAYYSLYTGLPGSHGFDPDVPVPGRVCWNELLTADPAAAMDFYSKMFGWQDQPEDMGPMGTYHLLMHGGKQAGGMMKNPMEGAPPMWLVYFLVEDLDKSTGKGRELGGNLAMPPTPIPGVGRFSLFSDPAGAMFALFESSKK